MTTPYIYFIQAVSQKGGPKPYMMTEECCWLIHPSPMMPVRDLHIVSQMRQEGHTVQMTVTAPPEGTPNVLTRVLEHFLPMMVEPKGATILQEPIWEDKNWPGAPWPQRPFSEWKLDLGVVREWEALARQAGQPIPEQWGSISLATTTGCVSRCLFCVWAGMKYLERPAGQVYQEVLGINPKQVYLMGCYMTPEWMQQWMDLGGYAVWGVDLHAGLTYSVDLLQRAKAVGLTKVLVGAESLAEAGIRRYRKPFNKAQVLTTLRACDEAGIITKVSLRAGNGESAAEVRETLDTMLELRKSLKNPQNFLWRYGEIAWQPGQPGWDASKHTIQAKPIDQNPRWKRPLEPDVLLAWEEVCALIQAWPKG